MGLKEKRAIGRVRIVPNWLSSHAGILLALSFFCIGHAGAQMPPDAVGPIIQALRNHDFATALTLSHSALEANPADFRIWTLRGMAKAGEHDSTGSLSAYQHALRLEPNYLPALEGAAHMEFQMGKDARPILTKILEQRPDDQVSHMLLGILDARKNDCSGALKHFSQSAPVMAHQPEALTGNGICLAHLNRYKEAVAAFAAALELDPGSALARYNLSLAQFNAHDPNGALGTLEPLVSASPGHPDALALAAQIEESKGDTAQAVKLLRSALLADPNDLSAYLQFAMLSFDHASPQVGVDILSAGISQMPNEPRLYLVRGILLAQLGEFTRAADDLNTASRIDPQLEFVGVAQGLVQSQKHDPKEALARFRAAVRAHPNEAYGHFLLAEALSEEGKPAGDPDYKEEIDEATTAVQLNPHLVEARDLLATAYLESGRMKLAIKESRAALADNPKDEQAIYHLILALRRTGQNQEISPLLKQMVALQTNAAVNRSPAKKYRLYVQQPSADGALP